MLTLFIMLLNMKLVIHQQHHKKRIAPYDAIPKTQMMKKKLLLLNEHIVLS